MNHGLEISRSGGFQPPNRGLEAPVTLNRRKWLSATAGTCALAMMPGRMFAADRRLKVAAICTEYTYRSHAHVILENFFEPYLFNGELTDPGMDVVAVYTDQVPKDSDLSRVAAEKYGFKIYPTIADALTLGGENLAVDAALSIGEHGDYPVNERGQKEYPRKRFFDEIVAVFRKSGRVVPLFSDKHLSYRFDWATEMMETAKELQIPFMAGSSVPLAQRRPPLELPMNCEIEEAVMIHGGPLEVYDFHALEVLQSMVEARKGGETGVESIQFLDGDAVWQAAKARRWSRELADAAMKAQFGRNAGPLEEFVEPEDGERHPVHAIQIRYRDGLKVTILRIGNSATRWNFACRLKSSDDILATSFYVGPWQNRNLFKALSHAIQTHFREKRAPYPPERTHFVSGMLAAAMDSRFEKFRELATPQLDIAYQPRDFRAMREMGASWNIITEDIPQPKGLDTGRASGRR